MGSSRQRRSLKSRRVLVDRLVALVGTRKATRVVLLLRHGIREDIPPNATGEQIMAAPLTQEGIAEAEQFGKILLLRVLAADNSNIQWLRPKSSPVPRCFDTVRAICGSLVIDGNAEGDNVLKHGTHCDRKRAWEEAKKVNLKMEKIVDRLVADEQVPGYRSL